MVGLFRVVWWAIRYGAVQSSPVSGALEVSEFWFKHFDFV